MNQAETKDIMAVPCLLRNLFTLVTFQRLTIALLVAFTRPSSSWRLLIFPVLIIWNIHLLPQYHNHITRSVVVAFASGEALGGILHYAEKILLKGWSFETYGSSITIKNGSDEYILKANRGKDGNLDGRKATVWSKFWFGAWVSFSDRYVASPHQATNTPPYSSSKPSYIPSHLRFLLRKFFLMVFCYIIIDVCSQGNQPELNPILYADEKIPLHGRLWNGKLAGEELLVRISTSLGFWFAGYWMIQGYYSTLGFLAVALGLSRPELERPIFGSFGKACTIRGFWGSFWHQLLRHRLTTISDYATYSVLRLPRSSSSSASGQLPLKHSQPSFHRILTRYTHILFCFLVSGVYHQVIEVAQGLYWRESSATSFFVLMAVGIMIEDAVQWVWFDVWGSGKESESKQRIKGKEEQIVEGRARGKGWTTIIGYLWVAIWFSFATPWYAYPGLRRNAGGEKDAVLPFSVVEYLTT